MQLGMIRESMHAVCSLAHLTSRSVEVENYRCFNSLQEGHFLNYLCGDITNVVDNLYICSLGNDLNFYIYCCTNVPA